MKVYTPLTHNRGFKLNERHSMLTNIFWFSLFNNDAFWNLPSWLQSGIIGQLVDASSTVM